MAKKSKPKRIKKTVRLCVEVAVEFDASIMPDDDWRMHFYASIVDHDKLAEHLAFNHVVNAVDSLRKLDGFADKEDAQASFRIVEAEVDGVSDSTRV